MEEKDFFGLFGCSRTGTSVPNTDSPPQPPSTTITTAAITTEAGTPNTTANMNELNAEDFGILMEKYQKQLKMKSDLKSAKVCRICFQQTPKYTCPKCGLKTCSLQCCQFHKQHFACDGKRDKLSFVPLTSYSNNHLQSDCKFLEEVRESLTDSVNANKSRLKRKITVEKKVESSPSFKAKKQFGKH